MAPGRPKPLTSLPAGSDRCESGGRSIPVVKRIAIGAVALAVAVAGGGIAWQLAHGPKAAVPTAAPAVPVSVAAVARKTVPVRLGAVGNVEPYTSVAVKARVDGEILSVAFREGDEVGKGALLFQIDPRPFAAALAQAQANLRKDVVLFDRASDQEVRYQELLQKKFISPDAYEQVRTNREAAAATVAADSAAIETAKLSLDYCTIRSPVAGYAGRVLIQQGNLVKANDANPLVTINQVVPVYVSFSVPEQNIGDIRGYQAAGALRVRAVASGGTHRTIDGRLASLDNTADPATGTIRLRAEFANRDKALWPGQFVNVELTLYEQPDAIVAPASALQNGPNGPYVFVVKPDSTVELRDVEVARTVGEDAVVASGLVPGEKVVTAGQLRLAPGVHVTAAASAAPS